jgi:hypothetical protein
MGAVDWSIFWVNFYSDYSSESYVVRVACLACADVVLGLLTFRNPASYIKDGHTATFNTPHFLYFFNKYTY